MPNKNYRKGANFESRMVSKLIRDGYAVKGGRFYASKGVCDIWWVDYKGRHNEAQLKFSSKKEPYISPDEMSKLTEFAQKMNGIIPVWLIKKQSRKPMFMERV